MKIPPPPKGADSSPKWAGDPKAKAEEKNWTDEEALKGQKRTNQLWLLKTLGFIVPVFMVTFALIFLGSLLAWSLHYILPAGYGWLTPEQLSKIQSVIFSGALGAIVSGYAQKYIS